MEFSNFLNFIIFCVGPTDFCLLGAIFTLLNFFQFQRNLKIHSGKPDISFKFNSDKNIISKKSNSKTKELYFRQISNGIRTNYYLKNGNIYIYIDIYDILISS